MTDDGFWGGGGHILCVVPGGSTTVECVYKSVCGQLKFELMGYQKPKRTQNWGLRR